MSILLFFKKTLNTLDN